MGIIQGRDCAQGIDISRHQGVPNFGAFNLEFAWIKATGGDEGFYRDSQFVNNATNWTTPWGPYHFASSAQYSAEQEANFFADTIMPIWGNLPAHRRLPPVLDWEPLQHPGDNSDDWVLTFLRHLHWRTGVKPMIYTGAYVTLNRVPELLEYDLWLAAYTREPIPCEPWGLNWSVWQFTSSARVGGFSGLVDSNWADRGWLARVLGGDEIVTDDDIAKMADKVLYNLTNPDGGAPGIFMGDGFGPINVTMAAQMDRSMEYKMDRIISALDEQSPPTEPPPVDPPVDPPPPPTGTCEVA